MQNARNGPADRPKDDDKAAYWDGHVCADNQTVARADTLRNELGEDDNEHRGDDDGLDTTTQDRV